MRAHWTGRIDLQVACLVSIEIVSTEGAFRGTADLVAETGGVLGAVSYPIPDLKPRLREFFDMAGERGLAADLHVDEAVDPSAATLREIARTVLETGFDAPVTVGHCCSLSVQDEAEVLQTLDLVAKRHPGLLLRFGGHAMAAGCTLAEGGFERFDQALRDVAGEWLDAATLTRTLRTDGPLAPEWFNAQTVALLDDIMTGPRSKDLYRMMMSDLTDA